MTIIQLVPIYPSTNSYFDTFNLPAKVDYVYGSLGPQAVPNVITVSNPDSLGGRFYGARRSRRVRKARKASRKARRKVSRKARRVRRFGSSTMTPTYEPIYNPGRMVTPGGESAGRFLGFDGKPIN